MDHDRWEASALDWLHETFATREPEVRFERLPRSNLVSDGSIKWRILSAGGNPIAFAIGSPARDPQQTECAVTNLSKARAALKPATRDVILEPQFSANVQGRSLVVYPYCRPLAHAGWRGRLARLRMARHVMHWLRDVTTETTFPASDEERDERFRRPLEAIARDSQLEATIFDAAREAIERLTTGQWRPQCTLIHNDFWSGNLLRASAPNPYGFVVIDWAGSRLRGQGVYDLVRISQSFRLSRRACRQELTWHCQTLGCPLADAQGYLLAALGSIGQNRGGFPYLRYRRLVTDCLEHLQSLVTR